jgi:DNA-binding CsgD family transcriptional regulator
MKKDIIIKRIGVNLKTSKRIFVQHSIAVHTLSLL